jgi:phosphate acetyltransferase
VSFLERVRERAAATGARIAFPESADPRTVAAVQALAEERIVTPLVVLDPASPASHAAARAAGAETVDPAADPRRERIAALLLERRRAKGMTEGEAHRLAGTPLWFADGLVALGEADGCVAGAVHTTGDVLRAALFLVGAAAGVTTVSSAFYMVVADFRGAGEEVLTFTDCAVVRYPTPAQLADIATAAAADRRRIVGDEPVVALLSFSTKGSAEGESVSAVQEALALLRARSGGFPVDGELQGDAALIPGVGERKAPGSGVAGRANVLVFPSLDAGNIGYKLVQRLAGASAVGPIVQGLAKPCSDLSRGAVPGDIINVAAITALQARARQDTRGHHPAGDTKS